MLELNGCSDTLVDLYCGVGTFARLLCTVRPTEVIGIEESASAIAERARQLRRRRQCHVYRRRKPNSRPLSSSIRANRVDVAVIDPPRIGCGP